MVDFAERRMADADIVETACSRAWSVYLLINKGVAENDARRASLERFQTFPRRERAAASLAALLFVRSHKHRPR
jgi:hypothetical protein